MFLTKLNARHLRGKWWRLTAPLTYRDGDKVYTAPVAFICDFASVPRVPLVYALTGNTEHAAAALHDLHYRWGILSRKEADRLFMDAMKSLRWGGRFRRALQATRQRSMYLAVKALGRFAYRNEPGQLDPRKPNKGANHYSEWRGCVMSYKTYLREVAK